MKTKLNDPKAQYEKMVNTPIPKLVTTLAVPTVISMLITSIYNMADTYFVSQINTQASAAVGICFPIMSIIQAIGFVLGMGSGSIVSRRLGEEKNDEACKVSATGFWTAIGFGLIVLLFGNVFIAQMLYLVGASETILPYAEDYTFYILYGAPFMCATFVLNNLLRAEGKAFLAMIGSTVGCILNIFMDPLFIFGFGMGIKGAALATFIGQIIGFVILLWMFLSKKTICTLKIKDFRFGKGFFWFIIMTGLPSLGRQGLASISSILLNRQAGLYGDAAIAAMSIATKICMFVASVMIGIGQGYSPVAGYNYGAKRYDRVRSSTYFMIFASAGLMAIIAVIGFIFAPQIMYAFRKDDLEVLAIGVVTLRWQIAFMPLHSPIVATNMLMQSTGHIPSATFLSCTRNGICFIPLIILLPMFFGIFGVETAQAFADLLSIIIALPFLLGFIGKLKKMEGELKIQNTR